MNPKNVSVGVLAASTKQLGELNRLVRGAGFPVAASIELRSQPLAELPPVDVWVVNLDLHEEKCQLAVDQLEATGLPIIFEEDSDLQQPELDAQEPKVMPSEIRLKRERRIAQKLHHLVREPSVDVQSPKLARASFVWVIAASTGGPEAVAKFLAGIPEGIAGVALIYAQHIESPAMANLQKVVEKNCHWRVVYSDEAQVIREKTIYLISPEHQADISDAGVLSPTKEPWGGRFRPSINQVIAKVARIYKNRSGAIVFTGMGDDGAESCSMMHHRGGQVWIQSVESCTIDSMPASVHARGVAQYSGEPALLAEHFVKHYRIEKVL